MNKVYTAFFRTILPCENHMKAGRKLQPLHPTRKPHGCSVTQLMLYTPYMLLILVFLELIPHWYDMQPRENHVKAVWVRKNAVKRLERSLFGCFATRNG